MKPLKKGDTVIYKGKRVSMARDMDDEIVCIEVDYLFPIVRVYPITKWVNFDEIEIVTE